MLSIPGCRQHGGTPAENAALRFNPKRCKPFAAGATASVDEAANALLSQGRWAELLMLWRRDLPLPAGLQEATAGLGVDGRRRVTMALRTHLDPSGRDLLADLLLRPRNRRICAHQ